MPAIDLEALLGKTEVAARQMLCLIPGLRIIPAGGDHQGRRQSDNQTGNAFNDAESVAGARSVRSVRRVRDVGARSLRRANSLSLQVIRVVPNARNQINVLLKVVLQAQTAARLRAPNFCEPVALRGSPTCAHTRGRSVLCIAPYPALHRSFHS